MIDKKIFQAKNALIYSNTLCVCVCPLFYYSILLSLLVEATVVVRANDAKAVSSVLESLSIGTVRLRFTICEVANDYELGTADALRTLRGRIKVSDQSPCFFCQLLFLLFQW